MQTEFRKSHRVASRGFTLIELLTVIAIISVLAAILFPIFGTVREQARQSNTMSSLYSTYTGARLYYEDEGRFPSLLYGYAEVADPSLNPPQRPMRPGVPNDVNALVPMDKIVGVYRTQLKTPNPSLHKGFLYRDQIKDYRTFLNSNDVEDDPVGYTYVYWPLNSPQALPNSLGANNVLNGNAARVVWKNARTTTNGAGLTCKEYGDPELPSTDYVGDGKLYYKMDSLDIGPMIGPDGQVVRESNGNIAYELHYTPDWSGQWGTNCDADASGQPRVTQLKYRNPPPDRTVLTYVTHHVRQGNGNVIMLLTSGTVRKISAKEAFQKLPLNYGK